MNFVGLAIRQPVTVTVGVILIVMAGLTRAVSSCKAGLSVK